MNQPDAYHRTGQTAAVLEPETKRAALACPLCGAEGSTDFLLAPDRFHLRTEMYRLVRCSKCTCVWQPVPPAPEGMGAHYTEDYHNAIMRAGESNSGARWKLQHDLIARFKQGGRILDIGCSSGAFLSTMDKAKWELYGTELSRETAELARKSTGATIFTGEASEAPYPPNSFDVITSFDLLEHVYDPRVFLSRVLEWLKPGGVYCLNLPNIDSWESRLFGSYWYGLEMPRHITHFSPTSLAHVMKSLGFEQAVLVTPTTTYVERSANYVSSTVWSALGFHPVSQAEAKADGLLWKAIRKGLRITLVAPFAQAASWSRSGGSILAVFRKPLQAR
jgi:2-polyprenyl-3-methyl-5-hydroxy-6-metoxy-1,4-benzoquinol methylase